MVVYKGLVNNYVDTRCRGEGVKKCLFFSTLRVLKLFEQFFWRFFLTIFFDNFFWRSFWRRFWQKILTNFLHMTNTLTSCLTNLTKFFKEFFSINFFDEFFGILIFLKIFFFTFNLLTIASFRLGVPLILFILSFVLFAMHLTFNPNSDISIFDSFEMRSFKHKFGHDILSGFKMASP